MKKQTLLKIKAKNPEKVAMAQQKHARIDWKKLREMRTWPKEKKDEFLDGRAQLARSKFTDRWVKYFPDPESSDGIDHNNPYLEVEWAMCDLRFLWKVCSKNKAKVEEALSTLSEEARDTYLHKTGPGNSKSYYEVSINGSMLGSIKSLMHIDKTDATDEELNSVMDDVVETADTDNGNKDDEEKVKEEVKE